MRLTTFIKLDPVWFDENLACTQSDANGKTWEISQLKSYFLVT